MTASELMAHMNKSKKDGEEVKWAGKWKKAELWWGNKAREQEE